MKKQRELVPLNTVGAAPWGYKCSQCGKVFSPRNGLTEAESNKVRAEFDAHDCRQDTSQAAARIERESTEGKQ